MKLEGEFNSKLHQMDFEGWEIVPEDGYLEIEYDGDYKIFSRKYGVDDPKNLYKNNYLICPSQDSSEFMESTEKSASKVPKQLLSVPMQCPPSPVEKVLKEIIKEPINKSSSASLEKIKVIPDSGIPLEADHDTISQVFVKKMIENKSVDMKTDSPNSNNKGLEDDAVKGKNWFPKSENEKRIDTKKEVIWGQHSVGVNIWKWSLNGFGAICSFGVVAASICIIILGGSKLDKQLHQQNKAQFHIFAEDKRIKQVVHHATKLNEAISTVRVPGIGGHITFGGYCESL